MKKIITQITTDPYRLFFPFGLVYLIIGVAIWFPLAFFHRDYYPVILHHYLMINGFIFFFVGGFLMTAIPKFSQSFPAGIFEVLLYFIFPLLGLREALHESFHIYLISFIQALFLIQFVLVRILFRKQNPPFTFALLPIGILLFLIMSILGYINSSLFSLELFFVCPISLMIFAIGSRLLPGILGHSEIVTQQKKIYERPVALHKTLSLKFIILGLLFIVTFFQDHWLARLVQFQIASYIAVKYWKLFSPPQEKSALTYNLWFTEWIFVLGFLLKLIWPDGAIHGLHWLFIGAFLLLIILISTRVTIAHAHAPKELENSKILYWITGITTLAMTTRVLAYVIPNLYESHLGYSAFLIIVCVLLWLKKYGKLFFMAQFNNISK